MTLAQLGPEGLLRFAGLVALSFMLGLAFVFREGAANILIFVSLFGTPVDLAWV